MAEMFALVLAGVALLLVSGDLLIRGAVGAAQALHVPPIIIGLTIVAFGTSAPELVVTVNAVLSDSPGIAFGNIIGSNIANILLVLGAAALVNPMPTELPGLRRNMSIMLLASALFAAFVYVGSYLDFYRGAALFALIVVYLAYLGIGIFKGKTKDAAAQELTDLEDGPKSGLKIAAFLIVGLVGLPFGAHLLVENGAGLARLLHVRDELIGLTLIAVGTSLPELATVIPAALRRHSEVALGNVVGSNIFNLLAVGGAAGLAGGGEFTGAAGRLDVPVMLVAALIAAAFIYGHQTIARWVGGALVAAYIGYMVVLGTSSGLM